MRGTLLLWLFFTAGFGLVASSLEIPLCLFKAVTGIPCPACGIGHACREALCLDFAASFQMHPLGIPAALALGLAYGFLSLDLARRRNSAYRFLSRPWPVWVTALVLGAVFGVWGWRILF